MLSPLLFLVLAEVAREGLLTPVAVAGVGDGSECGNGLVLAGVLEELRRRVSALCSKKPERGKNIPRSRHRDHPCCVQ